MKVFLLIEFPSRTLLSSVLVPDILLLSIHNFKVKSGSREEKELKWFSCNSVNKDGRERSNLLSKQVKF
jgi:hypothetical protein